MGILKVLQSFAPGNSNKTVRRNESKLFIGSNLGQGNGLGHGSKQLGAQFLKSAHPLYKCLQPTTNIDPDSSETTSINSQISNFLKLALELQHLLI